MTDDLKALRDRRDNETVKAAFDKGEAFGFATYDGDNVLDLVGTIDGDFPIILIREGHEEGIALSVDAARKLSATLDDMIDSLESFKRNGGG